MRTASESPLLFRIYRDLISRRSPSSDTSAAGAAEVSPARKRWVPAQRRRERRRRGTRCQPSHRL